RESGLGVGLWFEIVLGQYHTTHGSRQAPEAPTSLLLAPPETPAFFRDHSSLESPYDALGFVFQELRLTTRSRLSRPILPFGFAEPARRGEPWRRCSFRRPRYRPPQSVKDERHWPPFDYQG